SLDAVHQRPRAGRRNAGCGRDQAASQKSLNGRRFHRAIPYLLDYFSVVYKLHQLWRHVNNFPSLFPVNDVIGSYVVYNMRVPPTAPTGRTSCPHCNCPSPNKNMTAALPRFGGPWPTPDSTSCSSRIPPTWPGSPAMTDGPSMCTRV